MTQKTQKTQGSEYTRALARADKAGVKIIGSGYLTNGERFWLVSSATSAAPHIVQCVNSGTDQHCDCPARRLCTHVAICRRQLEADAKATAEFMRQSESMADMREAYARAEVAKRRDTAPLRRGEFSIWA